MDRTACAEIARLGCTACSTDIVPDLDTWRDKCVVAGDRINKKQTIVTLAVGQCMNWPHGDEIGGNKCTLAVR